MSAIKDSRRSFIKKSLSGLAFTLLSPVNVLSLKSQPLVFSGSADNDLYILLKDNDIDVKRANSPQEAIKTAKNKSGVIITAKNYPKQKNQIPNSLYEKAKQKELRLYIEYPEHIPDITVLGKPTKGKLERGVISSDFFGKELPNMSLLSLHDCYVYPVNITDSLISFAKVAGFNRAIYGLKDTDAMPLLFQQKNSMVATTALTNFIKGRYRPSDSWKTVWEELLSWLTKTRNLKLNHWKSDPSPSYSKSEKLPANARRKSITRGTEWLFNARFLIHSNWKDMALKYMSKDTNNPYFPPVGVDKLSGDGSLGILEGHASKINYDGSQYYRYWLRTDVQGESSFLLAAAGNYLNNEKYKTVAKNLNDFVFHKSSFSRNGLKNDKESSVYGLLGWGYDSSKIFYADDNARAVLGMIGASGLLKNQNWNKYIVENILANFRLSSKQGFFGGRLNQEQIQEKGWEYFNERDYVYLHPHYESWMWACYLWLYDKTSFKPLLDKAKRAIRITMEGYPDKWGWQNGIQQEKARMILPLAWLVRVEDTDEHREWLKIMVNDLLKDQQPCGAIREELGASDAGKYGGPKSNQEYGSTEAPLIANNGDPVADMLYTTNFAFFGLNEAAHATNNKEYIDAVSKLSEFLTRIQVKSNQHKDLDGAWFRAFEYNRWDYWASNADSGWGAWSTLTGWTQSWIVATQVLLEDNSSYWDLTEKSNIDQYMGKTVELMLE